jgi:glycosyltransferase involved in cell wall biosynthesis
LKITYFINHYPKVSHTFIRREILALERLGFQIQRIALHGWDDPLPDEEDQRERAKTLYVLKGGGGQLLIPALKTLIHSPVRFARAIGLAFRLARRSDRPLPYHLAYVAEACRVLAWMSEFGADRVHAHFGNNSTEVAMFTRVLGGPPYSFTIHGPGEFSLPMGLDEKIHRSAFVVAVSHFGRSQLYLRAAYEDWPKIKIVRCGLEKSFFDVHALPVIASRRLICVGRICAEKGQSLLVEAMAELSARGIVAELVLAGDGPMRGAIEALVAKRHLGASVRITGWISSDAVRTEILASRALVLPSFAEGLPVVLMEALALYRPVLTTYVAGIPELVANGTNGWLFPAGSVDALADAMADCLSMPAEALTRLGMSGHARVIENHSIDVEVPKLAGYFREG